MQTVIILMQSLEGLEQHSSSSTPHMEIEGSKYTPDTNYSNTLLKKQSILAAAPHENNPQPELKNINPNQLLLSINNCGKKQTKKRDICNAYYENYALLHEWMRKECTKANLSRQAFANTLSLMNQYYLMNPLIKNEFLPKALLFIVISSKAMEKKIIYTASMASINNFKTQQFLQLEYFLLKQFKFRVNSGNYFRIMTTYLQQWDNEVKKTLGNRWLHLLTLEDNLDSYLLFEEVYHLCDSHLKHEKSLFKNKLKIILKFILEKKCCQQQAPSIAQLIDFVFVNKEKADQLMQARGSVVPYQPEQEQCIYSYEMDREIDLQVLIRWKNQFQAKTPFLRQRYLNKRSNYSTYGEFLSLLY